MKGSSLRSGLKITFVLRLSGAVLSLVVSIGLARLLGPESFGAYSVCVTAIGFLAIPAQFGLGTATVKRLAAYEQEGNWPAVRALLKWTNIFVLLVSLFIAIGVMMYVILTPGQTIWGVSAMLALITCAILPIYALNEIRCAALHGMRRFWQGQAPETLIRPIVIIALVAIMYSQRDDLVSPEEGLFAYFLATTIGFLFGSFFLFRTIPASNHSARVSSKLEGGSIELLKAVSVLSFTKGGRVALSRIDIILVGSLLGLEAAGAYKIASIMANIVGFSLSVTSSVAAPFFSRNHAVDQRKRNRKLLLRTSMLSGLIALPLFIILVLGGDWIITTLYGQTYASAYMLLIILSFGQLFNAATGSLGSFLNMTGNEKWSLASVFLTLAVVVPGYYFFAPSYGASGFAYVSVLGIIVLNVLLLLKARSLV